jgi:adenylate kinase
MAVHGDPLAIILFGSPGSGKGTQAKLLRKCMEVPHISTGDMLREHIEWKDELGCQVQSLLKAGMLVPDEVVNRLVEERIGRLDCAHGFILDGYPRTLPQAKVMRNLLASLHFEPVVIHLQVDYNKVISRMSGRRVCPKCGTLYSLNSNPPKVAGICDKDGAALITRDDDSEPVIRQRLEDYGRQTKPLIEFFESSQVRSYGIDGSEGSPQAIANRICGFLAQS